MYVALLLKQSDYLKLFSLLSEYRMFYNDDDLNHKLDKDKKFDYHKAVQNFNQLSFSSSVLLEESKSNIL